MSGLVLSAKFITTEITRQSMGAGDVTLGRTMSQISTTGMSVWRSVRQSRDASGGRGRRMKEDAIFMQTRANAMKTRGEIE